MVVAAIPAVVALALATLERLPSRRYRPSRLFRRYVGSDVVYLLTGFVAGGSLAQSFIAEGSDVVGTSFGVPRLASLDLPLWMTVPAALVALDLGNYVAHSLLHRFDSLWEFHKVHHSIETLDWLATFRSHIVEQTLRRVVAPLLLILAGFPADAVALAGGVFLAWAIANHTNLNLKLGFLEPLFVTPRLHRIHHVPETDDRNFGTVFTIWDRLRGTLLVRDTSPDVALGVAGEVTTYPGGWLAQLVEPPRRLLAAWPSRRSSAAQQAPPGGFASDRPLRQPPPGGLTSASGQSSSVPSAPDGGPPAQSRRLRALVPRARPLARSAGARRRGRAGGQHVHARQSGETGGSRMPASRLTHAPSTLGSSRGARRPASRGGPPRGGSAHSSRSLCTTPHIGDRVRPSSLVELATRHKPFLTNTGRSKTWTVASVLAPALFGLGGPPL
jgi:sterol desaturase/sphingolipid hydroxylase (fatty acid hydroxylase superfamily)